MLTGERTLGAREMLASYVVPERWLPVALQLSWFRDTTDGSLCGSVDSDTEGWMQVWWDRGILGTYICHVCLTYLLARTG